MGGLTHVTTANGIELASTDWAGSSSHLIGGVANLDVVTTAEIQTLTNKTLTLGGSGDNTTFGIADLTNAPANVALLQGDGLELRSGGPGLYLTETDQTSPAGRWRIIADANMLFFEVWQSGASPFQVQDEFLRLDRTNHLLCFQYPFHGTGVRDLDISANYLVTDSTERTLTFSCLNATGDSFITMLSLIPNGSSPYFDFNSIQVSNMKLTGSSSDLGGEVLATGAGKTVDNVITALQNLGLVTQS